MLNAWKKWLQLAEGEEAGPALHDQRVAAAILMLEVARSDFEVAEAEALQLRQSLRRHWHLSGSELDAIMEQARREGERLHSLHDPVRTIRDAFMPAERLELIESLWEVAFADDQVDAREEHLIRRLAELLHVPHREFILRKHRAGGRASGNG